MWQSGNIKRFCICMGFMLGFCLAASAQRKTESFDNGWKFMLGDDSLARYAKYDDTKWRTLDLPHDWSIDGNFSDKNPTTQYFCYLYPQKVN